MRRLRDDVDKEDVSVARWTEKRVAVPCSNGILFCCIFLSCHCIQSAVSLNFSLRTGLIRAVLINIVSERFDRHTHVHCS